MNTRPARLYGTLSEQDATPSDLLKQFKDSEPETRIKNFLADADSLEQYERNKIETIPLRTPANPPLLRWDSTTSLDDKAFSLQKWEGIVTEIHADYFVAQLHDLTADNPEEEAELPINDISDNDKPLLKSGAVFYWSIGYFVTRTGQRKRESVIKFRRLPAWTAKEIQALKERAAIKRKNIGSR